MIRLLSAIDRGRGAIGEVSILEHTSLPKRHRRNARILKIECDACSVRPIKLPL